MSELDILEWFSLLGKDSAARFAVVRDLLRNARSDRMTDADVLICRRVLHGDLAARAARVPTRNVGGRKKFERRYSLASARWPKG